MHNVKAGLHVSNLLSHLQTLVLQIILCMDLHHEDLKMTQQSRNMQPCFHIIHCIFQHLLSLCLTDHPIMFFLKYGKFALIFMQNRNYVGPVGSKPNSSDNFQFIFLFSKPTEQSRTRYSRTDKHDIPTIFLFCTLYAKCMYKRRPFFIAQVRLQHTG